jgi:SAM-dependent methyltransferase
LSLSPVTTAERFDGARLDLGCGPRKLSEHHIGVDAVAYDGVDIVGEALDVLRSIPDGVVAEVHSAHFLEHVDDLDRLMGEMTRVLRPAGRLIVVVPHFSNPYFYSDPTHRRAFGLYSLSYYTQAVPFKRQVPVYGRALPLRLERVRLEFKSSPPFYGRHAFKLAVGLVVNAGRGMQEFYEENLSSLLPCYELRFELVRE